MYKGTKYYSRLSALHYIDIIFFYFLQVGLKTIYLICAGHVESCGASDRQRDDRVASIAWTRGPRDQIINTWLKSCLSELISVVDLTSYNG